MKKIVLLFVILFLLSLTAFFAYKYYAAKKELATQTRLANALLNGGGAALNEVNLLLAGHPQNAKFYYYKALVLLNNSDDISKKYLEIIGLLNDAIALDPLYRNAYIKLGEIMQLIGFNQAAVENYERALELGSENAAHLKDVLAHLKTLPPVILPPAPPEEDSYFTEIEDEIYMPVEYSVPVPYEEGW